MKAFTKSTGECIRILASILLALQFKQAASSTFLRDIGYDTRANTCHQDCIPGTSEGLVYNKLCCEDECGPEDSGILCWGGQSCDCKNCKCVSPPKPQTPPTDFCPGRGQDGSANPPTSCPGNCYAAGDPYYTTMDGIRCEFQGAKCYLLSGTKTGVGLDSPFTVAVQNAEVIRNGVKKAFSKEVIIDLKADHHVIVIKQRGAILVDGYQVPASGLPVTIGGVIINVVGPITIVNGINTKYAFFLQYESRDVDGRHLIFLSVYDDKYHGKLEGLCGNWNGVPEDDLIPKNEYYPGSCVEFGNSWITNC